MTSAGGLVPVADGARAAASLLLSGPAGGVRAAAEIAAACGYENAVSFDMGGTSTDVYAQHLNSAGVPQWTGDGVVVCGAAFDQYTPRLVTDGGGGAIISWDDYRDGDADVYAQRINAAGLAQWAADGRALCTNVAEQYSGAPTPDGAGGAYVPWTDYRNTLGDIYVQRVTAAGAIAAGWRPNGDSLCIADGDQQDPAAVSDGSGGLVLVNVADPTKPALLESLQQPLDLRPQLEGIEIADHRLDPSDSPPPQAGRPPYRRFCPGRSRQDRQPPRVSVFQSLPARRFASHAQTTQAMRPASSSSNAATEAHSIRSPRPRMRAESIRGCGRSVFGMAKSLSPR
jgi:hypothetical protein